MPVSHQLDRVLLVPLGDPRSINLELLAEASCSWPVKWDYPIVLIGSWGHWQQAISSQGLNFPPHLASIKPMHLGSQTLKPDTYYFFDIGIGRGDNDKGDPYPLSDLACGQLSWGALQAVSAFQAKRIAVLTLPISKYRAQLAGMGFAGQTEFFEQLWEGEAVMLLAGPKLRVGLATNHHALSAVSALINEDMLIKKILTLADSLPRMFDLPENLVRIGVCGLNPHASDQGLFGNEESRVIHPAIVRAQNLLQDRASVKGPLPADTAFYQAASGQFDVILAMYHDQGLGPLKLIHFSEAINVSLGLRHLRLAPDHGPAEDLIGKKVADATSLKACFSVAQRYLAERSL